MWRMFSIIICSGEFTRNTVGIGEVLNHLPEVFRIRLIRFSKVIVVLMFQCSYIQCLCLKDVL